MTPFEVVGIVLLVLLGGAAVIGILIAVLSALASGWDH